MFRAVDTGEQIQELGLIKTVVPHMKTGGVFICSGGRFPNNPTPQLFTPLTVTKLVKLEDYSDGYPFTNNMGVILQK